ncbi:MAG: glycosyltransferase family 2 protein [Methylococcales symbiont of Iophon sp. n. MRB-2018]|nr:MAG: glycosyltransferase family 2 protein [Methylococcales symbiont of Iophon sp. n. MRB-2018]
MHNNKKIVVVIPCYKVADKIQQVVKEMPDFVDDIIVIDDACPQKSGQLVKALNTPKTTVLLHQKNQGVGASMVTGFKYALELQADIIVKVDGDGQMDLQQMHRLIAPLEEKNIFYAKGSRFMSFESLGDMPKIRLIGNSMLSFTLKIASGYWFINDVANGYIAIDRETLAKINLDKIAKRYFFESDMIIQLGTHRINLAEVAMPTIYQDEKSSMNLLSVFFSFPTKIIKGLMKRIFLQYFVYDFNMASVYLLSAIPMLVWGGCFGAYRWYLGLAEGLINNTGIVMLAVLPLILGMQFLLQAISIDISNSPKKQHYK